MSQRKGNFGWLFEEENLRKAFESSEKEIQSVKTGACLEAKPCIHIVTVQYTDNTVTTTSLDAVSIAEKYAKFLDENARDHFALYLNQFGFRK